MTSGERSLTPLPHRIHQKGGQQAPPPPRPPASSCEWTCLDRCWGKWTKGCEKGRFWDEVRRAFEVRIISWEQRRASCGDRIKYLFRLRTSLLLVRRRLGRPARELCLCQRPSQPIAAGTCITRSAQAGLAAGTAVDQTQTRRRYFYFGLLWMLDLADGQRGALCGPGITGRPAACKARCSPRSVPIGLGADSIWRPLARLDHVTRPAATLAGFLTRPGQACHLRL